MLKAYKYRLYPNKVQTTLIEQHFNACRLVYNIGLEIKKYAWDTQRKNVSAYDLIKQLPGLKQECPWIKEVNSQSLVSALLNLDRAFKSFFSGGGYPRFKSKKYSQSFCCPGNRRKIDFVNKRLTLPKLENIPIRIDREFSGQLRTVTVSRTRTGKYFASILVEDGKELPNPTPIDPAKSIGLDVGIKSLVVSSSGQRFEPNQRLKQNLKRLRVFCKRASRKKKGSRTAAKHGRK